jgi:16S rRNA (guanine527-N7)-methyltransferase
MEFDKFSELLTEAFENNNLSGLLDDNKKLAFYRLYVLLVETNKITNLTAITDPEGVILKHFVDSATATELIKKGASVIDVGCGAGFPSLPLAILRDDITVTSLDSTGKKIEFVKKVADELKLTNINPVNDRAEDYCAKRRESFDCCISRAVARLNILSELCLPFVKVGGKFVAMKSNKATEELAEADRGIALLGG